MTSIGSLARLAHALLLVGVCSSTVAVAQTPPATLILRNADIWTVDDAQPTARALAIAGNRIVKVGNEGDVMALATPETRVLDLNDAFVLPGFTDTHTHFGSAVEKFFEVRLIDVNDEPLLLERLRAAAQDIPEDVWITGYDWSSAAASGARRREDISFKPFVPSLAAIDRVAPRHPVLLRRYDGVYFMNTRGFELARVNKVTPDPANGEYQRDPLTHELTGLLLGSAGPKMAEIMPPPSRARDLIGARAMLSELSRHGITSIHDIARVDEISQTKLYPVAIERSFTDLSIFKDLRARGELTVRVYPILTLANWRETVAYGITPGSGDDTIRYGALKVLVDSSYMSEPFANNSAWSGGLSFRVLDEQTLSRDIVGADALGFDTAAHVTGDRAHRMVLDWYEDAIRTNPPRDRRFRLIHAWYPSRTEVERAGRIHAIADIQPHQLIHELSDIEERLGPQRAAFSYPWRAMIEQGMHVTLGSDWPGSFDRKIEAPLNPLVNIYYAVTRQSLEGLPSGGFHKEQALTVDEAIRGYTIAGAFASRQEAIKGSITEGKLADLVVLSRNLRKIPARELPHVQVRYTIFDGRVVYEGNADAK
jgi:predicted amidohydrolase YtcJ